jgi:very-short-patch-repair endonuclease
MSRFTRTPDLTERARRLRRDASKSERALWRALRSAGVGASFRRQHPIGPWTLDYYCAEFRLAVEVDGPDHDLARDRRRDAILAAEGVTTLRFSADLARDETEAVAEAIASWIRDRRNAARFDQS